MEAKIIQSIESFAERHGIDSAAVLAVIRVESTDTAFYKPGKPVIQFEGYHFSRYLASKNVPHRSYAKDGYFIIELEGITIKDRVGTQKEEWNNFETAMGIDYNGAIWSTSFGLPQIMGFNYRQCGCQSLHEFYAKMCDSEEAQIGLFLNFLASNKALLYALQEKDWKGFARLYNGPMYYKFKYHEKLKSFYERIKKERNKAGA
jgi:hypothetical protein